jgi:hypothetical protein
MVRRSSGASFGQPVDPFVELGVALEPDGIIPALGFQQIKECRNGKGGIGPEPPPGDRGAGLGRVARQHRLQNIFPAICAVHIAGTQGASLQVAKLVEHEQRVQALRLEVTIPHCPLLIAMHRALGAVHVQRNDLWWALVVHRVDPATWQIDQRREVLGARQHLSLEPAHRAGRGRAVLHRPPADKLAHHRIAAEPVRVIDVLVSGKARENGLAQEARETMPSVLSCARITDQTRCHVRQTKGVVQFTMKQQSTVRADRRPTKFQLDRPVKLKSQRACFAFTRRVRRQIPTPSALSY